MKLERTITVDAKPGSVWTKVGRDFHAIGTWARAIDHSYPSDTGSPPAGLEHAGRVCESDIGTVRETVLEYDESAMSIMLDAKSDKLPGFVRSLRGGWRVSAHQSHASKVLVWIDVDIAAPFNLIMGPMMRLKMGSILSKTLVDLKHVIETGKPHPKKQTSLAKKEQSVAA